MSILFRVKHNKIIYLFIYFHKNRCNNIEILSNFLNMKTNRAFYPSPGPQEAFIQLSHMYLHYGKLIKYYIF